MKRQLDQFVIRTERVGEPIPPITADTPEMIHEFHQLVIQPYRFGHDASKATCLWLKGLPPLTPTAYVEPRYVNGKPRWSNQTDGGQNKLPPTADRWKIRSKTFTGIAKAMADQWGR